MGGENCQKPKRNETYNPFSGNPIIRGETEKIKAQGVKNNAKRETRGRGEEKRG